MNNFEQLCWNAFVSVRRKKYMETDGSDNRSEAGQKSTASTVYDAILDRYVPEKPSGSVKVEIRYNDYRGQNWYRWAPDGLGWRMLDKAAHRDFGYGSGKWWWIPRRLQVCPDTGGWSCRCELCGWGACAVHGLPVAYATVKAGVIRALDHADVVIVHGPRPADVRASDGLPPAPAIDLLALSHPDRIRPFLPHDSPASSSRL